MFNLFSAVAVAELIVDVFNHGLSEGQACAFPLADELPILGTIEQVQGLLVVVEFGLAGGHVPEDIMHDRNALKAIVIEE